MSKGTFRYHKLAQLVMLAVLTPQQAFAAAADSNKQKQQKADTEQVEKLVQRSGVLRKIWGAGAVSLQPA